MGFFHTDFISHYVALTICLCVLIYSNRNGSRSVYARRLGFGGCFLLVGQKRFSDDGSARVYFV